MKRVHAFAPATSANVSCGFDLFGLAINDLGDEVIAEKKDSPGVTIVDITGDDSRLPRDPKENAVSYPVIKLLEHLNIEQGIALTLHKKLPLGSGLGSSSASSAASLTAVNTLLGSPLTKEELIPFAMEGERLVCGAAHADNVAPAILGGFVLIRSYTPLDIVPVAIKADIWITIVNPDIEIRTADSRRILRKVVDLPTSVQQSGNTAGVIVGLMNGDTELLRRSMVDAIIEPQRALLIPGFHTVKHAAFKAGAFACSISGSGPSVFALSTSKEEGRIIGTAMQSAFNKHDLGSKVYVSQINRKGSTILSTS